MDIKLYECTADVISALDAYFDNETERQDTIEAVIGQFEAKAQSVAAYCLNLAAQGDLLEEHIKAMQAKLKACRAKEGSLKDYLARNMKAAGILKIEADNGSFSARFTKNPPARRHLGRSPNPRRLYAHQNHHRAGQNRHQSRHTGRAGSPRRQTRAGRKPAHQVNPTNQWELTRRRKAVFSLSLKAVQTFQAAFFESHP